MNTWTKQMGFPLIYVEAEQVKNGILPWFQIKFNNISSIPSDQGLARCGHSSGSEGRCKSLWIHPRNSLDPWSLLTLLHVGNVCGVRGGREALLELPFHSNYAYSTGLQDEGVRQQIQGVKTDRDLCSGIIPEAGPFSEGKKSNLFHETEYSDTQRLKLNVLIVAFSLFLAFFSFFKIFFPSARRWQSVEVGPEEILCQWTIYW